MREATGNRILMNVPQQRDEIIDVINRLTLETVLKDMPRVIVFGIVMLSVRYCYAFNYIRYRLTLLPDKQMNVIRHEAIRINYAARGHRIPVLVLREAFFVEKLLKLDEIGIDFKDVLVVDSTQDYVIKAR